MPGEARRGMARRGKARQMKFIMFDDAHFDKGMKTIVMSGIVIWTAEPRIYGVPDETVKILKKRRIPFEIVNYKRAMKAFVEHAVQRIEKARQRKRRSGKTVPYRFDIDRENPRFKAAYRRELARLQRASE